ncbi:MAG TPA: MAPEG family protein [Methylocella sp.]|nr:MAPEG family protein [Methylocella sp.]
MSCGDGSSSDEFNALLPPEARWKADNYNHLMEQPTLFYAATLTLAFLGAGHGVNAGLAWAYAVLRTAHSLFQALINIILLRFAVFMAASAALLLLTVWAALIVF